MKTNILKSFVAMLAIAATVCFAGCKDDESDADIIPNIAIAESTMSFTNAEETKTLALESNADWQAVVPESADWVTVNPMSGNGDKTVTIAVAENTTGKAREAEVKFSALHPTYGVYDTKKLTIIQSANENEVEEENAIYSDNFDKITAEQGEKGWPFLSADYTNPKGSAAANVTYNINNTKVSVRTSGKASNDSEYSSYKGSGVNKVFFGATPTSLVVENIALPADQQNYVLSFGANNYNQDAADNTFKNENFIVSLSKDGVAWTPIEYSFAEGVDLNGKWNLAEASLKLAEVPEALYIKFEAKISSTISIDDIKLSTGGAGEQEIVFAVVEDIEGTVTEILEAEQGANVKAIDATVVAVSSRAYLLTDGTSYILAYMSEDAPEVAVGDKVTVEGEMGSYGTPAVPQIVNPVATKTGTVENFAQPEAVVIDGAALDAYKDNFAIKYVKIADANLTKKVDGDKVYWNFSVEGATTATGSLAYPTAEMCPDSNHAKKVDIYGYVIYLSGGSSQYVNVIVTSIEVKGEGEEPAGPSEELGDDERYLSDEGLMITEDGDVKAYANAVTIEGKKYPALKLGTSKVVGSWTTAEVGVEGDYTLSFYAFGWSGKEAEVTVTVDEETVLTVQPIANANISGTATNFPVTVDQEKNFYSVELKGLTAESTITFATTEGKYRAVLFGIQLNQPETSDPVEMTPAAVAEGYQGAKVTWEAVEGAEAYVVSVVGNDAITPVEVAGDKTEAVITGLADARKYVFAVEAIDAEENLLGEGETAETEVWTLVNWEEPEFSLTLSEDKSKYVFMVGNLAEPNYIYAGGEIKIYKDGAAEPIYTLKNMTSDAYLNPSRGYGRWKVNEMNNRKDWTWYDASGTAMAEDANNDGNPDEWNSVPASFFAAGEYTLDYTIYYAVNINGTWATHDGSKFIPQDTEEGANFIYFEKGDNVLAADGNVLRQTKTNGETPVELATIAPTLEFTSVTAKAEGYQGAKIEWSAVETADAYKVVVNGAEVEANGELSHTVAPETLTDANEYTFTVKAYKGADVIAQKDVKTQVYTLTNRPEPEIRLVDGVLELATDFEWTDGYSGTYTEFGNLHEYGILIAAELVFYKDGATTPSYTAVANCDHQAATSAKDYHAAFFTHKYAKGSNCFTVLKAWHWNDSASASDVAPEMEPGTYTVKHVGYYAPIIGGKYNNKTNDGTSDPDRIHYTGVLISGTDGNNISNMIEGAIRREGATTTTIVIADPDAEPVVLNAKAAIDEGTVLGRTLWGNNDSWYNGIASVNGLFESVKLSWDAVEADKIVITYNGETVEVEGTATEKVIEDLETSPVEFTIKAVKGSETLVEEKVSSDVYTLPTADTGAQWVAKYTESGYQILGTGWNTKQYTAAHVTFNVYEKGSTTAVFDKDVNYKGNLGSIIAWTMGEKAPNGVCYAGPGNRACHGGDGNNWDENNLPTGATVVDGKEVFTGLDPEKEYVVKYTLKVWPYIYDATHAQNVELYTNANGEKLFNYFFKKMLVSGTADTYYNAVDLQGEADLTFEGVPEVVALATPVVEAAVEGNVVTLSWAAVEGAAKYRVSVGDETTEVEETTFEYEGEYETDYTFTVVAVAADTTKNTDSEPATATATTEAAPAPAIEKITIAEFISKADAETVYELTGQIVDVQKRTKYSNFVIKDETGEILIYGLVGDNTDDNGVSVMETKGIDGGDEITVQGTYTLFGSTHEIEDATYVSHTPFTGAWITNVSPAKVAFLAAGGTENITVTMRNGEGVTPTLSGLTAPFSATWNNGVVAVTATENTSEEAVPAQTLTIAVEGGNSVAVEVSQKGVVVAGTKEYDIIDTVAALEAGVEYTLGGYGTSSKGLYCYTGGLSSGHGYTAAATYDETTGALTIEGTYNTTVKLEAVDGVANAYRIYDVGKSKYLTATAASSGKLSLVDSTSHYWVFEAGTGTGLSAYQVGLDGATPRLWMSTAASSKLLRSASSSYTDGNMIFFKKN